MSRATTTATTVSTRLLRAKPQKPGAETAVRRCSSVGAVGRKTGVRETTSSRGLMALTAIQ